MRWLMRLLAALRAGRPCPDCGDDPCLDDCRCWEWTTPRPVTPASERKNTPAAEPVGSTTGASGEV